MPTESEPPKTKDFNIYADGKLFTFVRVNSHKVILECPGILVSQVNLPLNRKKRIEFARTSRRRAKRMRKWISSNGNSELNPELASRITLLATARVYNPVVLFTFIQTETKKDFDVGGKPSF